MALKKATNGLNKVSESGDPGELRESVQESAGGGYLGNLGGNAESQLGAGQRLWRSQEAKKGPVVASRTNHFGAQEHMCGVRKSLKLSPGILALA